MKKLSKSDIATRDELVAKLNDAKLAVNAAVAEANFRIAEANITIADLNAEIATYNSLLSDVGEWRDEIVTEMECYIEGRSEKWQDSDAGGTYLDWKGAFESLYLDGIEEVEPLSEIDEMDPDEATVIEELPEAPEQ